MSDWYFIDRVNFQPLWVPSRQCVLLCYSSTGLLFFLDSISLIFHLKAWAIFLIISRRVDDRWRISEGKVCVGHFFHNSPTENKYVTSGMCCKKKPEKCNLFFGYSYEQWRKYICCSMRIPLIISPWFCVNASRPKGREECVVSTTNKSVQLTADICKLTWSANTCLFLISVI